MEWQRGMHLVVIHRRLGPSCVLLLHAHGWRCCELGRLLVGGRRYLIILILSKLRVKLLLDGPVGRRRGCWHLLGVGLSCQLLLLRATCVLLLRWGARVLLLWAMSAASCS